MKCYGQGERRGQGGAGEDGHASRDEAVMHILLLLSLLPLSG